MRKITVALLAVGVLAAVGGAAAASRYIITSIHQIKPGVVAHLRGNRGPAGHRGPQGEIGPQGRPGLTAVKAYASSITDATPCCTSNAAIAVTATCPAGTIAVSGGWLGDQSHEPLLAGYVANGPSGSNGWTVVMLNEDTQNSAGIQAFVDCALGGVPGAADARTARAGVTSMKAALAAARRLASQRGASRASSARR